MFPIKQIGKKIDWQIDKQIGNIVDAKIVKQIDGQIDGKIGKQKNLYYFKSKQYYRLTN